MEEYSIYVNGKTKLGEFNMRWIESFETKDDKTAVAYVKRNYKTEGATIELEGNKVILQY